VVHAYVQAMHLVEHPRYEEIERGEQPETDLLGILLAQ
jgi:hypothetical protein